MKRKNLEAQINRDMDAGLFKRRKVSDMDPYREAAQAMLKDKSIHLRINGRDLEALKTIAAKKGKKYQTLIGEILHREALKAA